MRIAEQLGYERAVCYDSPALYPDVWVQLCRAADITERIELGPGVLIPSLRHPMVTASAISTLVSAAGPERVIVGVGAGFTGQLAMGQPPVPWAQVRRYVLAVQALLRGERVEWDGGIAQMIHPDGRFAPALPITVPWAIAAEGPKGLQVARDLGAELFRTSYPDPSFSRQAMLRTGTVLDEGRTRGRSGSSTRPDMPPHSSCTGRWSTGRSMSFSPMAVGSGPRRTTTFRRTSAISPSTTATSSGSTRSTSRSSRAI
ncbi:LLM class flavin-dependent oxidoreductase [Actinomadura madurae]|uniref:LLM class flavin-dependent oxidoreductase n=1 Tax=Actinomadura madurae TaxID=1993 RepID=UPI0020D24D18|nr:LLM class flavin-dependent oxidoreductase [Actinomadura madurae]MCP9950972.1 LLM class flavin-dependent oxidoreductase [Actinomadura madurae]MCP9967757.1 LLM class flavin-dependent oxidoreductase [Actinomadura madurae]MCP9980207.1 LLM class flavin-dependent oxidoreductase [Actinomadura madurae]MCQ0016418.1 LLM class flavin-dependent oxidoreductase [Actinomadura madurae]